MAKFSTGVASICRVLCCRLFLAVFNRNLLGDRRVDFQESTDDECFLTV